MLVGGSGVAGTGTLILVRGMSNPNGEALWWIAAGFILLSGAFLAFGPRTLPTPPGSQTE